MKVTFLTDKDREELEGLLLPKPTGKVEVGQYLVVRGVNEAGDVVSVEAVSVFDGPSSDSSSGGNVDLEGYATEQWVKDQKYLTAVPDGYAKSSEIPKKPEDIGAQPSGDYALKSEIPSVPVQSVNGKTGVVKLSASDVGARPGNWMPTAQEVGALPNTYTPPNQTAEQVGADPKGTATSVVSQHNASDDSHGDIRLELKAINDRLTAFFDSDNQTLDELSEIVAYITSNKSLIDSITTSKVSVADIVNNLTSNVSNKPLSAAQGVVLKGLIDVVSNSLANYQPKGDYALRSELPNVPTKLSEFTNDSGFITGYTETDPTVPAWAKQSTKPSYSKSEVGLDNVANERQYSANNPPPYPVTSVNGQTGDVKLDSGSNGGYSVEILLPSEAVAVVGVEFNIYHKSVFRCNGDLSNIDIGWAISGTGVSLTQFAECLRITATDSNVGNYTLTAKVRDIKTGTVIAEKSMLLRIIANTALTGRNVLFIGDSLTASRNGLYAAEIQYNLSGGGMVSIGTQNGSKDTNQIGAVKHEGYNGATVDGFLSANVASGNVNPFYNPSTGAFDFAYFMSNQGYSYVDAVCLNLGHNNIGNHAKAVFGLTTIAASIHAYDANIPVIISLIEPLAGQDAWRNKPNTAAQMRTHWRNLLVAYMDAFDNGKISNVYLSAPYFNIDPDNDFPTETVARSARDATQIVRQTDPMHPGRIGTLKMADVYYANLLCRITDSGAILYTVTNNLTNVTNSNSAGAVRAGASYTATLTADSGYDLGTVSVTMGGQDVAVTNGVISISSVTGDIVITATATAKPVVNYTNLADPSTANDASPNTALTADEWLNGYYISSKKMSAKADLIVTNKIPLTASQKLRVKGFTTIGTIGGSSCMSRFRILPCDASGTALVTEIQPALDSGQYIGQMDEAELEKGIYCFTPNELEQASYWANVAFVRICGYPIDGNNANVIVTVNEPIE